MRGDVPTRRELVAGPDDRDGRGADEAAIVAQFMRSGFARTPGTCRTSGSGRIVRVVL